MAEEVQTNGAGELPKANAPVGEVAASIQPAGSTNSKLADILAKKSRGETLTRAEVGYLGGISKKKPASQSVSASAAPPANRLLDVPANHSNPLLQTSPENKKPADSAVVPLVDSVLLRKTANGICSSMDRITRFVVGWQAKRAGGDKQTVTAYKDAVSLQTENRDLIVEGSEPAVTALCKALDCSPEKLNSMMENSALITGLVTHFSGVHAALEQIKEDRLERERVLAAAKAKV